MLNQKAIKKARGALVLHLRSALSAKTNQIEALLNHLEELESEEVPIVEQAEKFLGDGIKLWNANALSDITTHKNGIKMFDDAIAKVKATENATGNLEIMEIPFADKDFYFPNSPVVEGSDIPIENITGVARQLYDALKEAELSPRIVDSKRNNGRNCYLQVSW